MDEVPTVNMRISFQDIGDDVRSVITVFYVLLITIVVYLQLQMGAKILGNIVQTALQIRNRNYHPIPEPN